METVADPDPPRDEREVVGERVQAYLRCLSLVLSPDGVRLRVEDPLYFLVQRLQVLKASVDLGLGTVEAESHGVTSHA